MGNQLKKDDDSKKDADPEPKRDLEPTRRVGPGLRKVLELIRGNSSPDAGEVAKLMRKYPDERAEILAALHEHAGNGFVSLVLAAEREEGERLKPSISGAGVGVSVGDWNIGVKPATSTDDRYDSSENRRRAEGKEDNDRAAQAHGEVMPDPVMDLIKPKPKQLVPAPEVDAAIADARDQIAGRKKEPLEVDPVTLLPVIPGLNKKKKGLGFDP